MKRVMPDGIFGRNPWWRDEIPTITSAASIIMRWGVRARVSSDDEMTASQEVHRALEGPPFEVRLRQLDGVELLQIVGLDHSQLKLPWPSHGLATRLAGNAFSAFNVIPCIMALVSAVEPECKFTRGTHEDVQEVHSDVDA
jgi:hypothetical protein